jgi:subtilisin family serine protease
MVLKWRTPVAIGLMILLWSPVAPETGSGVPQGGWRHSSGGNGTELVGAPGWHQAGVTGAGVRVAVVDIGFDGYRQRLGDELPSEVVTASFRRDGAIETGSSHGTAAAEIVHDVAPGAELHLVAFDFDLWSVVDYLIAQDIDVVSFSIGYLSGPFDGTSPISRAVQWGLDEGLVWITAAGNYARRHWGGPPADRDGDGWLDVAPGRRLDHFTVAPGQTFDLHVSWLGDADLELCLFDERQSLACTTAIRGPGDRPTEHLEWRNPDGIRRTYGFGVRMVRGTARRVDVFAAGTSEFEHFEPQGSVLVPGDVEGAVTVGAVPWWNPTSLTSSSSRGPTADGRTKPDVVGPAGVATSVGVLDGTSAATPHVAGVAALLLEAYPETPPEGVADLIRNRAHPFGDSGDAGAGLAHVGPRTPGCRGLAPTIVGTPEADILVGTPGPDVIQGRGGPDVIDGGGGDDVICGGSGADLLNGGAGNDRILGGGGADRVSGDAGNDSVQGGSGPDLVLGGTGADTIWGGPGDDRCPDGWGDGCEGR